MLEYLTPIRPIWTRHVLPTVNHRGTPHRPAADPLYDAYRVVTYGRCSTQMDEKDLIGLHTFNRFAYVRYEADSGVERPASGFHWRMCGL